MDLTSVLEGTLKVLGAGVIYLESKELFTKYYLPWTKKVEKELEKTPMDDYRFSEDK
jgi:hypothetical protein